MKKFFPVFKVGTHTDSKGNVHKYSDADVEALFNNYDPDWLSAPFTTDHKADGPAFGYAKTLKFENGTLYASSEDMSENLREAVKKGHFGRVSIELFKQPEKGRYLKAISFLGVKTPSIKGLEGEIREQTEFSGLEPEAVITFEATPTEDEAYELGDVVTDPIESTPATGKQGDPPAVKTDEYNFEELQAKITKLEEEKSTLESKFQQTDAERQAAQERLTEIEIDQRKLEFEQWLNGRVAYGSVKPRQKDKIMELLMALDGVEMFEEGDQESVNPVKLFQDIIEDLPKVVENAEQAKKGEEKTDFTDPLKIASAAEEYQEQEAKKGRQVSTVDAVSHVIKNNQ